MVECVVGWAVEVGLVERGSDSLRKDATEVFRDSVGSEAARLMSPELKDTRGGELEKGRV